METHRDKKVIILITVMLSFLFTAASIVPIFLPSFLAYVYGFNSSRDKKRYGISMVHVLVAAIIGGLIFLVISIFMLNAIMDLRSHPGILLSLAIAFVLNYVCCAIFYFLGTKQKLVTFN